VAADRASRAQRAAATLDAAALAEPRAWLVAGRFTAVALAAYAAVAIALAFAFAHQINPDGISYLRIAGYYAHGDVGRAVSAYWSPLYSWLLVPFLWLGVPGLLATKLLGALLAVAWVWGVARLGPRYVESRVARGLLLAAAAVAALGWSMERIAPDLLLAAFIAWYLCMASDPAVAERPGRAFLTGVLGGLAALAKIYALPFVSVHWIGTVALAAWAGTADRRWGRRALVAGTGLLGFGLVVVPWVVALSVSYGQLTITTAAARNQPIVVDRSIVLPPGLRVPPEQRLGRLAPGRLTSWETPDRYVPAPLARAGAAATDRAQILRGRLLGLGSNLIEIRDRLVGFDYFHLALPGLLAAMFMAWLGRTDRRAIHPPVWGIFTVAVWSLGFLPLLARDQRYFWPVAGLLLLLAGGAALRLASTVAAGSGPRPAARAAGGAGLGAAALVAVSFFIVGAQGLVDAWLAPRPEYRSVARRVAEVARHNGIALTGPLAGNEWPRPLYTAYLLDRPMAGVSTAREPTALADELSEVGVTLYLVFDDRNLAAQLRGSDRFRHLGDVVPSGAPNSVVAVFELAGRKGSG
jgi:hypothetical protein